MVDGEAELLVEMHRTGLAVNLDHRQMRADDYRDLLIEARSDPGNLRKIRKRFEEIVKIDFFGAPGKEEVAALMSDSTSLAPEYSNGTDVF